MNHLDVTRKQLSPQAIFDQLMREENQKYLTYRNEALNDFTRYVIPFIYWHRQESQKKLDEALNYKPKKYNSKLATLRRAYYALRQKCYQLEAALKQARALPYPNNDI